MREAKKAEILIEVHKKAPSIKFVYRYNCNALRKIG